MFNRPTSLKQHLFDTTLPHEIINLVYINQSDNLALDDPFAMEKPGIHSIDLSHFFGKNGEMSQTGIEMQARANAKEQLEAAFCTVIVSNNENNIIDTLQDLESIMGDSNKWPQLILITPKQFVMQNEAAMRRFNVHIEIEWTEDNTALLDSIVEKVRPIIGTLLNNLSKELVRAKP